MSRRIELPAGPCTQPVVVTLHDSGAASIEREKHVVHLTREEAQGLLMAMVDVYCRHCGDYTGDEFCYCTRDD